jgi:auxin response factor
VEETQPVVNVPCDGYEQMAASLDVDSGELSQPSNVNNSSARAASSERALFETQSRQVRSCTKVTVRHILKMLDFELL